MRGYRGLLLQVLQTDFWYKDLVSFNLSNKNLDTPGPGTYVIPSDFGALAS